MKESNRKTWDHNITVLRVILLFSIVSAHSSITQVEAEMSRISWIWSLWQVWSTVGVPGFLILSGYLFKGKPIPIKTIFNKKVISLVVPWLIGGTVVYIVAQYGAYDKFGYLPFLFGYGSYLYYMSILVVCFALFYFIYDKTSWLCCCMGLNCLSLLLTQTELYQPLMTDFLNVCNWIGYFAVGCLFKKYRVLECVRCLSLVKRLSIAVSGPVIIVLGALLGIKTYFYLGAFPIGCVFVLSGYALCTLLSIERSGLVNNIGNWSFSVYLFHMPVVSLLKKLVRLVDLRLFLLIPAITVAVFSLCFSLLVYLGKRYRAIGHLNTLIGMR